MHKAEQFVTLGYHGCSPAHCNNASIQNSQKGAYRSWMPAHVFFQLELSTGPASEFPFKFLTLSLSLQQEKTHNAKTESPKIKTLKKN